MTRAETQARPQWCHRRRCFFLVLSGLGPPALEDDFPTITFVEKLPIRPSRVIVRLDLHANRNIVPHARRRGGGFAVPKRRLLRPPEISALCHREGSPVLEHLVFAIEMTSNWHHSPRHYCPVLDGELVLGYVTPCAEAPKNPYKQS